MKMLEVRGLCKSIAVAKTSVRILTDISFRVEPGEIIAVTGRSGCGKSTLLGILSGLDKPSKGNVIFNDTDLFKLSEVKRDNFRNNNIGMIFQNHNLIAELTCYENMIVPLVFANAEIKADKLLNMVGLTDKRNLFPYQMSGGEQQRTSIARALAHSPKLLLADEPTGNLDYANAQNIMALFKDIIKNFNTSVVIVTHDMEIASQADRVLQMADGRIA